mgnify:FL=1
MNILWIKDNNVGHEKQVKVLLDELSKTRDINVIQLNVKGFHPLFKYVDPVEENLFDLIIGAGHKTYSFILDIKKSQKKSCKTVAILTPSFNKDKFDLICAPAHDQNKFNNSNNVIFFEGSLAKVSLDEADENIILVAIGGKSKHYYFDEDSILNQIEYFLSVYPNKEYYVFNSKRTPVSMNNKIAKLVETKEIIFCDYKNNDISFESILHKSSAKLITRDSVNMVFESLSCKGNTYLVDMKIKNKMNKVVKTVNNLIEQKKIGYIEQSDMVDGLSTIKIHKQNVYNDVFAEVEKVAYKLNQLI